MAAMDDLHAAITALETAATELDTRLLAYDPGTYDVEIMNATSNVALITTSVNELAPTPSAPALELKAVV